LISAAEIPLLATYYNIYEEGQKMENLLMKKLDEGRAVVGLSNSCPASCIIERMCAGWDFVWIDAQHGQHDYRSALEAVRTAEVMGTDTVLRVPGHEYGILGPYADTACSAIMVPMVDDARQARDVVDALCFPPLGKRSFGGRRMVDLYGRNYYRERKMLVIAQIETPLAAENVEDIVKTEGIDMVFFGPDDMKIRLDIGIDTPALLDKRLSVLMERTADAARKAGKYAGCIAATQESLRISFGMGYRLFACGGDVGFIKAAADNKLAEMRKVLDDIKI
jgi:4-hydroxy-2-oxoheptanedioate aldolase